LSAEKVCSEKQKSKIKDATQIRSSCVPGTWCFADMCIMTAPHYLWLVRIIADNTLAEQYLIGNFPAAQPEIY